MPSCVMRFCTNYTAKTSKSQGITYHTFPANEIKRVQWIDIVRKQRSEEGWQPNRTSKICSVHFKDEDKYTSGKGLTMLRKSAFPVLQLPPALSSPASPNSLAEEEVADLESIFDSPQTAALKKCIEKISSEKQKWINKYRNLKKQNKRLEKRLANLNDILKQLKMVKCIRSNCGVHRNIESKLYKKNGEKKMNDDVHNQERNVKD